jgi:DNA-binding response OmpR family regulator
LKKTILCGAGFQVFPAADATSAEEIFAKEAIDLVVISVWLAAGGSGYEEVGSESTEPINSARLAARLRANRSDLPVLFLLSRSITSDGVFNTIRSEDSGFDHGAISFLIRGRFGGEDMIQAIRGLLG